MLFKSQVYTQASGSIGGITYSHNKSGMYTRGRSIPTDPLTTQQSIVRASVSTLITRWNETLTQAQRDGWDLYASNVLKTNALGDQVQRSGQNWYVACNLPRLQGANVFYESLLGLILTGALAAPVDTAPSTFDRGETGPVSILSSSVGDTIDVSFDNTQAWANEDDAAMLFYVSRPRNPSRKYFKGPWRLAGAVLGNGTTAPTSPAFLDVTQAATYVYDPAGGQLATVEVVVLRADGRMSERVMTNSFVLGAA